MHNYPPGVTGNEPEIVGSPDYYCETCDTDLSEEEIDFDYDQIGERWVDESTHTTCGSRITVLKTI